MRQALQILYGVSSDEYTQERQYLLQNVFTSEYSVRSNYSTNNYLGSMSLGSLELLCFSDSDTQISLNKSLRVPQSCFKHIMSFLNQDEQLNVREIFQLLHPSGLSNYKIDPSKLKAAVANSHRYQPQKDEIKYVNIEMHEDEADDSNDFVIEITPYANQINSKGSCGIYVGLSLCLFIFITAGFIFFKMKKVGLMVEIVGLMIFCSVCCSCFISKMIYRPYHLR